MNNLKGFAFGILTSATFGLIPLFTLPLMAKGMQFDSILFYRFLFAALALAGIMAAKTDVYKRQLILLGFFYTASAMFLFWGYNFMSAGIATTLHFTYPVFVTLIMLLFFREKTSWITLMAIVLAICGVARLSIGEEEIRLSALGVFIVLLSALGYALYITTVNKFLAGGSTSRLKIGGRKLTFYVFVVSTALFAIKAGTNQGIQPIPDSMSFVNLILLAIVPTVISNITLVLAVHNIGGTLTAVLGAVEPITAVCVGILVFSEPFTPNLAVGILLIIIAVTMIILSKSIQGTLRKLYRKAAHFQVSK